MLRDEFQAALQELVGLGQEQLQRLTDFAPEEICPSESAALKKALRGRRELLEELAELSRRRRDLPGEGNRERAQFSTGIDRLLAATGLRSGALCSLARDESEYLRRIQEHFRLGWSESEREVLLRLADNAETLADLLERDVEGRR